MLPLAIRLQCSSQIVAAKITDTGQISGHNWETQAYQQRLDVFDSQAKSHLEQVPEHQHRQELREEEKRRLERHRMFKTSNYEGRKCRRPAAHLGTCAWVVNNSKY